jgi:hypothetical protein
MNLDHGESTCLYFDVVGRYLNFICPLYIWRSRVFKKLTRETGAVEAGTKADQPGEGPADDATRVPVDHLVRGDSFKRFFCYFFCTDWENRPG